MSMRTGMALAAFSIILFFLVGTMEADVGTNTTQEAAVSLPPQGLYDDCDISMPEGLAHLDIMGAAGFSLVLTYNSGISGFTPEQMDAYLDRAQKNNIKVIWDFNELVGNAGAPKLVVPIVEAVKNHPATWGYYIGDENSPSQAASVKAIGDAVRAADPDHPRLYVGNYFTSTLTPFVDSADVLGLDVYPIGQYTDSAKMVAEVGNVSGNLKEFNAQHAKRTAIILQAFNWADDSNHPGWKYERWPTRAEMRAMRDQSLASNPEMILWFSYNNLMKKEKPTDHWNDLVWAATGK